MSVSKQRLGDSRWEDGREGNQRGGRKSNQIRNTGYRKDGIICSRGKLQ